MSKNISISIRVSEDDLMKFKQAARLEAYASYSEFIRRTAPIEGQRSLLIVSKRRRVNHPTAKAGFYSPGLLA